MISFDIQNMLVTVPDRVFSLSFLSCTRWLRPFVELSPGPYVVGGNILQQIQVCFQGRSNKNKFGVLKFRRFGISKTSNPYHL